MKVLVLGGTGMLGSKLVDVLSAANELHVRATYRGDRAALDRASQEDGAAWAAFDAERDDPVSLLTDEKWIVNAIGVIKPLINERDPEDIRRAVIINSVFPFRLAAAAQRIGAHVIQIATDCVFSGRLGSYREDSPHDPLDVYGKTKSLGEVSAPQFLNLRCSIVGPEMRGHRSLLAWFLSQPRDATVRGFINHRWNGVTTLHFGQIVLGLIRSGSGSSGTFHVVPADSLNKAELLREFANAFDRADITVKDTEASERVDRTLATVDAAANSHFWRLSGRTQAPSLRQMIQELAETVGERRVAPEDAPAT